MVLKLILGLSDSSLGDFVLATTEGKFLKQKYKYLFSFNIAPNIQM
jgi:hypothetical protein